MIFIKNMLNKTMVKHVSKKSTVAIIKIRKQFMVPEKKQALIFIQVNTSKPCTMQTCKGGKEDFYLHLFPKDPYPSLYKCNARAYQSLRVLDQVQAFTMGIRNQVRN
jgi:hypothetical protein